MADIDNVDVTTLARAAQDSNAAGKPAILDVREDYEWQAGHIDGALHVPLDQLPNRLDELDPDEDLHVICRTGGRSYRATNWLIENGYSALNVSGGMGAWMDAELPMVSETGEPPRVL